MKYWLIVMTTNKLSKNINRYTMQLVWLMHLGLFEALSRLLQRGDIPGFSIPEFSMAVCLGPSFHIEKGVVMESSAQATADVAWFYEQNGQRLGPVSELTLASMIKGAIVSRNSLVWRDGLAAWTRLGETELKRHLDPHVPPPLTGSQIKNNLIWVLAAAPLIGLVLEAVLSLLLHGDTYDAELALVTHRYWFVTLALNIALSYFDEQRLKKAGYDTSQFKGWVWLVPVYLYQRATALGHSKMYFTTWIVCFVLSLWR